MAGIRARIDAELDTSKVDMQFNKMMSRLSGKQINFNVNSKSFTQPLGRITASANEFTKSLEASNARVIAFGASVGIINAVTNAFKGLIVETIKFEKTLADINVILNSSSSSIEKFGHSLFGVAKNTAQSFNTVATAALEFSRQGLSMEETLKRTSDALILTRLTSLKAEESVAGLTAAVNAFAKSGLTTTQIIDKLAAVDVKFAVSSEDLIKALERTGAVAIDAGVKLDNLIGLVTALQQTTARGGSVIGNGLKTIFTRIQRPDSIKQLEEMGLAVRSLTGTILPADKILLNMARSFDKMTQSQQSNVVQFSAGIFQANVFRAALRDLAKEQSIYAKASDVAANAAGEAAVKNEQLNKTISALANRAGVAVEELAEVIGKLAIQPELGSILDTFVKAIEGLKSSLGGGEDEGSTFAKGFVRGIGNVLTGPVLFAFAAVFVKMLGNVSKFASQSLKDVLNITTQKDKMKKMEESIVAVLSENKHIQEALNNLEGDRLAQEKFILKIIEAQTNAMEKQKALAKSLAGPLLKQGVTPDLASKNPGPIDLDGDGRITSARGIIPSYARDKERRGAIQAGYSPGAVSSMNVKGLGPVIYNKAEEVKMFPGMKQPAIMPPGSSKAGKQYKNAFEKKHGFDPYASGGFIPNFAKLSGSNLRFGKAKLNLFGNAQDIGRASGINYRDIEREFQKARPSILMKASLRDIIGSSDKGKMEITGKEHLFDSFSALAGAGVETIERRFGIRPIPPGRQGQGKLTNEQFTERKTKNLLNKEQASSGHKQTHMLTFDPKTKKGQPNYPADVIALGDQFPSQEVKSGRFTAANIISKSLRLSSDRELSTWMKQHKVSGGKNLDEKNLKKAQALAGKLGLKGSGEGGEFTQMDADQWGMSQGFVPNFTGGITMAAKSLAAEFNPKNVSNISHLNYLALARHVENSAKADQGTPLDKSISTIAAEMGISESTISNSKKPTTTSGKAAKDALGARYNEYVENLNSISGGKLQHHIQRGLDFEEQLLSVFGLSRRTNKTAPMDYNQSEFEGQDAGRKKAIEMLSSTKHGDAYAGPDGHAIDHFMAKALREQEPNIAGFLQGKKQSHRIRNTLKFADIIGTRGGKTDDVVKGEALISDIAEHSKIFFERSLRDAGYAPTKPVDGFIRSNPKLRNKTLLYKYTKDFVDIGKVQQMASESASSGFIPNFDSRTRDQKINDVLADPANKNIKFNKPGKKVFKSKNMWDQEMLRMFQDDPKQSYLGGTLMDYLVGKGYSELELKKLAKNPDSYDIHSGGLIPNFRYWAKHVQFTKGMDGGWGIKGDTSHLHGFIDYLEKEGGNSQKEIDKLKSQLKQVGDKRYKEIQDLGYPSMGREGAQYYSKRRAISERKESLSLKGVFLKNLKQKIYDYNDEKNSTFSHGLVPNFANPLADAIDRERAAGLPDSKIRVTRSDKLRNKKNPMGLAVINTRDEPRGIDQGIARARKEGANPLAYGASRGVIPNFAQGDAAEKGFDDLSKSLDKLNDSVQDLFPSLSSKIGDELMSSLGELADSFREAKENFEKTGDTSKLQNTGEAAAELRANLTKKTKDEFNQTGDISKFAAVNESLKDFEATMSNSTRKIEDESRERENGLQQLFYMQSAISMANGFLEEFASKGDGAVNTLAKLGLAASNVTAAYIQQKELIPEFMEALGGNMQEGFSIGELFNSETRERNRGARAMADAGPESRFMQRARGLQGSENKLGRGFGNLMGGVAKTTKFLTRLLPVVGQLYTGFTILNEGFKLLTGKGIFEHFASSASRATKKIEELGKVSDAVANVLDQLKGQESNNLKLAELEAIGSGRTIAQEKEYLDAQLKQLKIQSSLSDSMQSLFDKTKTGELGVKLITQAFGKTVDTTKMTQQALEQFALSAQRAAALETVRKGLIQSMEAGDSFSQEGMVQGKASAATSAFSAGSMSREFFSGDFSLPENERKKILESNIAQLEKLLSASNTSVYNTIENLDLKGGKFFTPDMLKDILGSEGIADAIDNFSGNIAGDFGLTSNEGKIFKEAIKNFINGLQKGDVSEGMQKILEATTQFQKELRVMAKLAKHESDLRFQALGYSLKSLDLQDELIGFQNNLKSQYGKISSASKLEADMQSKFAKQARDTFEKRTKANKDVQDALEKQASELLNVSNITGLSDENDIEQATKDFVSKLQSLSGNLDGKAFDEFNKGLVDGAKIDFKQYQKQVNNFLGQIKGLNNLSPLDFQSRLNDIFKQILKEKNNELTLAVMLSMKQVEALNTDEKVLQARQELYNGFFKQLKGIEQEDALAQERLRQTRMDLAIKAKTIEGATILQELLAEAIGDQEQVNESLKGEAATLAVLNDAESQRLKLVQKSTEYQALIAEKLRENLNKEVGSGRDSFMTNMLTNGLRDAPQQDGKLGDIQKLLMEQSIQKLSSEMTSATAARQEAELRLQFMAHDENRLKLAEEMETKDTAELADKVLMQANRQKFLQNSGKRAQNAELLVIQEILENQNQLDTLQAKQRLFENTKYREIIAKQINDLELQELQAQNGLTEAKLKDALQRGVLEKTAEELAKEEILQVTKTALINAHKQKILEYNKGLEDKHRIANELMEVANKLQAVRNAKNKAAMDQQTMDALVAGDIDIERFDKMYDVRRSGTKANMTGNADDLLKFANAVQEFNKATNAGTSAMDALRVRMAQIAVDARDLGGDLVNIGLDTFKGEFKQALKDIGSGTKSAGEAFKKMGLTIMEKIFDRIMDHNIDKIISNFSYALTGVDPSKDAKEVATKMNTEEIKRMGQSQGKLISALDRLTSQLKEPYRTPPRTQEEDPEKKKEEKKKEQTLEERLKELQGEITASREQDVKTNDIRNKLLEQYSINNTNLDNVNKSLELLKASIDGMSGSDAGTQSEVQQAVEKAKAKAVEQEIAPRHGIPTDPRIQTNENMRRAGAARSREDMMNDPQLAEDVIYAAASGKDFGKLDLQETMIKRSKGSQAEFSQPAFEENLKMILSDLKISIDDFKNANFQSKTETKMAAPSDGGSWARYEQVTSPDMTKPKFLEGQEIGKVNIPDANIASFGDKLVRLETIDSTLNSINQKQESVRAAAEATTTRIESHAATNDANLKALSSSMTQLATAKAGTYELVDSTSNQKLGDSPSKSTPTASVPPPAPAGPGAGAKKFFGGKIQKFKDGGFVNGMPGVDKVPAMLSAGEYVMSPEEVDNAMFSGGKVQYFNQGTKGKGVKEYVGEKTRDAGKRAQALGKGMLQAGVMTGVAYYFGKKYGPKAEEEKPPEFDKNQLNALNTKSTVNFNRSDARLSGRFIAQDPVIDEYGKHLLDVHEFNVRKKNKKVEERIALTKSIAGTVLGMAASTALGFASDIVKEPLAKMMNGVKNKLADTPLIGKMMPGAKDYQKMKMQNPNANYSDFRAAQRQPAWANGEKGSRSLEMGGDVYVETSEGGFRKDTQMSRTLAEQRKAYNNVDNYSTPSSDNSSVPVSVNNGEPRTKKYNFGGRVQKFNRGGPVGDVYDLPDWATGFRKVPILNNFMPSREAINNPGKGYNSYFGDVGSLFKRIMGGGQNRRYTNHLGQDVQQRGIFPLSEQIEDAGYRKGYNDMRKEYLAAGKADPGPYKEYSKGGFKDMFALNNGGQVPAMLTAGETVVPASAAQQIGYSNLNVMNQTGQFPTVQGPAGIDKVGPVGLNPGDFVIRKSSTQKLAKTNPNLMRYSAENPGFFRRGGAVKGYYNGGLVEGDLATAASPINLNNSSGGMLMQSTIPDQASGVGSTKTDGTGSSVTNNINVSVTIDQSGQESVSTSGDGQDSYEKEQELSMKIKSAVLDIIRQEKRVGGELS